MRYDIIWERASEPGVELICRELDVRTLVARLIKATRENRGGILVKKIQVSSE